MIAGAFTAFAQFQQPRIKELPVVIKPRERPTTERVIVVTKPVQPSRGVLAVVLSQYVNAQVIVKDLNGRVLDQKDAGDQGQAEFQLRRGKVYEVEASYPGFLSVSSKSKPLGVSSIVRLTLVPQFASLKFRNLPTGAQVLIDDKQSGTADQNGDVTISGIAPGSHHSLAIRHPEYNDYTDTLPELAAGVEYSYGKIPLTRVATLTILGPPGATILIDGSVEGKINPNGVVRIDYGLDKASEHTISADLLGFQPWSQQVTLSPGPRAITVKLDPIVTSTGDTDFFDNLSQWNAPPSWKIVSDGSNKKLEVNGDQLGLLRDRTYRDFVVSFNLSLKDGKGATWAVRADKECRNYYLFHLAGPNSATRTPMRLYSYLIKDGEISDVSTPFPVLIVLNQKSSYNIRILVKDHEIRQLITDNLTGDESDLGAWTDTNPSREKFLYGSFGFRALSDEVFTVDDLTITLDLKQFKGN